MYPVRGRAANSWRRKGKDFRVSLYPLKFKPLLLQKMWGGRKLQNLLNKPLPDGKDIGESWELYDFPPGLIEKSRQWVSAVVAEGPLAGKTLHELCQQFGKELCGNAAMIQPSKQFPLLLKFLDARQDLSIQVHPDQAYCSMHQGAYLKSECWYIVQADPGAKIYKGLVKGATRDSFMEALAKRNVEQLLNAIPVEAGQCFYLPAGTVHAVGAGVVVAEVQTPSDTTYRVYDFNRVDPATNKRRQLHLTEALACIDFSGHPGPSESHPEVDGAQRLVTTPYFLLDRIRLAASAEKPLPAGQPIAWIVLEGEGRVTCDGSEGTAFGKGDTLLLPAGVKNAALKAAKDSVLLDVRFPSWR